MGSPQVTVIVPVHNRQAELRRALVSLAAQTLSNFECLVVDDCSTVPIAPVLDELDDDRFTLLRTSENGGPYAARAFGYARMRGEYLFHLDSDWEAFPWALEQAARHLDETPEAGGVAGLHLEHDGSRLFVRIRDGKRLVTPAEFATRKAVPDCVGAVRREVVTEWLAKRDDYYALEAHQWITFSMRHSQLYVDEPWTRYHQSASNRVSDHADDRELDDYRKFLDEHDDLLRGTPNVNLDELLLHAWIQLRRAGRKDDAHRVAQYMEMRGMPYKRLVAQELATRALGKAGLRRPRESVVWV